MTAKLHPLPFALLLALGAPAGAALAAEAAATVPGSSPPPAAPAATTLDTLTVSASGLALDSLEMSTPASVLDGDALVRRREASLGDTLAGEPGITATHFGAGASRPIIRGMDGARVRLLADGAEIMDASTASPDHAVAGEPLLTTQIEVLRGPSALAYGGGALGGVVNLLDRRVPSAMPERGVDGSVELRGNSAAGERTAAFELTAGAGSLALHAEGLRRQADDYRVGDGWSEGRRVTGSHNDTDTASFGLAHIGTQGYLGLAVTRQRNDYGLPGHGHELEDCHSHGDHLHCGGHGAEEEDEHDDEHEHEEHDHLPVVALDSTRWDLRGEYREPFSGFAGVRVRASHTDYRHDELEDGTIATRFRNRAQDGRVELEHHPLAGWRGVLGLQGTRRDFRALGAEAYVQPTLTRRVAAFLIEEYRSGNWRFDAGLRQEWQQIEVDAAAPDRRHRGSSASLGAVWDFAPEYALAATLSRAQRLPTAEELYADGLHLATRTLERGNAALEAETSRNLDLSLRKHSGDTTFTLSAFHNRVADFIHARTLDAVDGLQLIEYAQRDATFTGVEGRIRQRINAHLGLALFGDAVRARLAHGDGDRDLARIPAHRVGVGVDARWGSWTGELEWYRVGRQDDIAAFETATPGYHMLNLGLAYSARASGLPWQFYAKLANLGDELAFSHTSFIKEAAPLSGRKLTLGLRLQF